MVSEVLTTGQIWMSHNGNFHKMSWELLMTISDYIFNNIYCASILSHTRSDNNMLVY